ncbi:pyridoxal-5'-phosphate-dependent protein [Cereibacter changlensis JA139]|uniref:Pyridoxal-5'-phosphate-dependent protein n=2 Tax=Cereibacter changlensis TaxID=402884 RepID=A0A2T4JNU5_9RHOB|nr:pyridoxal-5'-phosphate-dependent protein [Cereibacter changlensis JA139]
MSMTPVISPLTNLRIKMEHLNPGGSHKSRAARYIIESAIVAGELRPGGPRRILEKSGGNFGIGLAYEAAKHDIGVDLVIGLSFSPLKRVLCQEYGARLVGLDLLHQGMQPKDVVATLLAADANRYFFTNQFANPGNFEAHLHETGPEIVQQVRADLDRFAGCSLVLGAGTGAHAAALATVLRESCAVVELVLVEPENCSFAEGRFGDHAQKGTAVGVLPPFLDFAHVDRIIPVSDAEAFEGQKRFARETGFYPGPTSGANYHLACQNAATSPERLVISMIYDAGDCYLDQRISA